MTIEAEEKPTFTAEELAEFQPENDADDDAKGADAQTGDDGDNPAGEGDKGKTIVTGADGEEEDKAKEEADAEAKAAKVDRNELTEDLRKAIAEHYAAGDKKLEAKELKRLERVKDIKSLWGMYREMEGKFTGGGLVKVPGKDAKPEEVAAYHKAIGVPDKPEDYLKDIKLENGAVIGEADKPVVGAFAQALHKAGAPPTVMNAALNWYYQHQEAQAAELDDADDTFRRESEKAIKEELGPAFKRQTNAIATLFTTAPGGADASNPNSLYARLVGGRTADGKIIGNDPDVMRWLIGIVGDVNPAATVVEDGASGGKSIDTEINEIEKIMREDRKLYNQKYAERYGELLAAREKIQARQRA